MTKERIIAKIFNLTDENWLKHANPWSAWSRFSVLPLILFSFWARIWIGWWCLIPAFISILWMMFNPILFPKAKSTRNWMSKAVMGERVYLNRDKINIPQIHKIQIHNIQNGITFVGLSLSVWAVVDYSVFGLVVGIALTFIGKSWYLDRMVWLFEDMKDANEEYKSWDY